MRRREFISVVGSTVAWPLAARAQQPMPVIGFLHTASPATIAELMPAFRKGNPLSQVANLRSILPAIR
jgi:putative tryptophan/tyrosine transport system substrate-binding protein